MTDIAVEVIAGVYLRACGATSLDFCEYMVGEGLSPRMRSNHEDGGIAKVLEGSISAHAEQPLPSKSLMGKGKLRFLSFFLSSACDSEIVSG